VREMAIIYDQKRLQQLDKIFKIIFIIGLIVIFAVAIAETQNYSGFSPTASQVATVGYIVVLLLVIAAVIYSQFPPSVLGKPIKGEGSQ
jgi:membrane protein YdbS with pleckstrin-like domain